MDYEGDMTVVGSPYYMASEVLRGEQYDESCDVFSLGLLIASLGVDDGKIQKVFSEEVREGKELTKMQKQRLKGMAIANRHARGWRADLTWWVEKGGWSREMKGLVERCWEEDREKRPKINDIAREVDAWTGSMFVAGVTKFTGRDDGV